MCNWYMSHPPIATPFTPTPTNPGTLLITKGSISDNNHGQWELLHVHTVVSLSQVPWNHAYNFSHISISKQFKCGTGVQIHSES